MDLTFKAIDLKDIKTAFSFLRDTFFISFGDDPSSWPNNLGQYSEERYLSALQKMLVRDPNSIIHVWQNEVIIGQIELSRFKNEPLCGFVDLYYMIPEKRRSGLGKLLDAYAMEYFSKKGFTKARLTVTETNFSAIAFYERLGWRSIGPHEGHPHGILMEKSIG